MDIKFFKDNYEKLCIGASKALQKYKKANSSFWVNSLCFYTILSLVPIFAILLSIGTWFGMSDIILKQLDTYSPLKRDALNIILQFSNNLLENARGGILAGLGFIFLAWTLISMFSVIENALNDVWHVYKSRSIVRKVSDYISFFICIPLLLLLINGSLIFLANKLQNINILFMLLTKGIPFISLVVMLTVFNIFMPNTRVKLIPAFLSAFVTSTFFAIVQYAFLNLQSWINTYNFIYGSFAGVFIFFVWIRITWFLIILGAHFSFILQNQDSFYNEDNIRLSFDSRLRLALILLLKISENFKKENGATTLEELSSSIKLPNSNIENILSILESRGLILSGTIKIKNEDINCYSLTKAPHSIKIKEVYDILSKDGENIDFDENESYRILEKSILDQSIDSLGGNNC